ncbi:MAG: hypothetical protein KBA31_02540 [Alphaproteobacteria bacterium]|nr:hypothetical protein [Alphaproteobacteria bacterium]
MSEPASEPLEDFLRRLGWGLQGLPDRMDIVAETRAHVLDCLARGERIEAVLAGFGTPEEYARSFVDGMELSRALSSEKSGDLAGAVLRRAHRSVVAGVAVIALMVLGACAFAAAYLALLKVIDPSHAGLWWSESEQFIGVIDDPSEARELLGLWVFPVTAAVCAAAWITGRFVLLWAARNLLGDASSRK